MFNLIKITLLLTLLCITTSTQAQITINSRSTSSQSNFQSNANGTATFEFQNTSFAEILEIFGISSNVSFDASAEDILASRITYREKDIQIDKAIALLLTSLKARVVKTKSGHIITATKPGEEILHPIRTLNEMKINRLLAQPVRLSMRHTPLEMVVRFAAGMSQLDIQIDHIALREAGIKSQIPVSIDSGSDSLGMAMKKLLKPHGLVLEIVGNTVVVTTKDPA